MMRLHTVDYRGSACDGPGIRTVIFHQGCRRRCPNCHNPSTWDEKGGYEVEEAALVRELLERSPTKRVTISGGEPLLQPEAVEKLVGLLNREGFDIALYTGFHREDVPPGILAGLNYLKTGEYIDALRTTVSPYIGSRNQVFETLKR